jgi:hypothetical protein
MNPAHFWNLSFKMCILNLTLTTLLTLWLTLTIKEHYVIFVYVLCNIFQKMSIMYLHNSSMIVFSIMLFTIFFVPKQNCILKMQPFRRSASVVKWESCTLPLFHQCHWEAWQSPPRAQPIMTGAWVQYGRFLFGEILHCSLNFSLCEKTSIWV